jgi:hypothetical protein
MRMTPKEAAECANQFVRQEWLLSASPEEICGFFTYCSVNSHAFEFARTALFIRMSRDAERLNRRILWLTVFVAILTGVLVGLTVVLVVFTQKLVAHP